jgi:hypothetical protein
MSTDGFNGRDDVKVGFGASVDGLAKGFGAAVDLVRGGTAQMTSAVGGVASATAKLTGLFAGLMAITAGGKLFSTAITDTNKLATEVGGLSRRLQISTGEASAYSQALDQAGMSADDLAAITQQMTTRLRTQEDAFKAMGVKTRDTTGAYLNQRELLESSLTTLRTYRSGTDQLMAAQQLLGRSVTEDVLNKLFLMQEALPKTREEVKELGLEMGVENVKAARAFTLAAKDVDDVATGLKVQIGNALIPVFTELMRSFSSGAAGAIPLVRGGFKALGVVLLGLGELLFGFWNTFVAVVRSITVTAVGLTDAMVSLLSGDFAGAKAKWGAMTETIAEEWEAAGKRIAEQSARTRASMDEVWNGPSKTDEVMPQPEGRSGDKRFVAFDKNASKDALELLKRQLELMKQAEGDYKELSKQAEVDFWRTKLSLFAKGTKEWFEVNTLYLKARRDAAKEAVDIQKAELDQQMVLAGNNEAAKVALATSWLARMVSLYGQDSKEYREALRSKTLAERAYNDQQRSFENARAELVRDSRAADIDIAREQVGMLADIGAISKQAQITLEREMLQEKHNLATADLQRKALLYADDVAMQEQIANEKRRLDEDLQRDITRNMMATQRATYDSWNEILGGVFSTIGSVTSQLLARTITWKSAMLRIGDSLLQGLIGVGVKWLQNWVMNELLATSAAKAGAGARAAVAATGAAAAASAKASETTVVIASNAAEAATGAAASQAAIPVIGPALAMAAAAAMLSFVMGFGSKSPGTPVGTSLPSARGGWWDIPRDTLAMVHEEEMIMPPELSRGVRELVESGGARGGGSMAVTIHAIDGQSVAQFFERHASTAARSLTGYAAANNVRSRR